MNLPSWLPWAAVGAAPSLMVFAVLMLRDGREHRRRMRRLNTHVGSRRGVEPQPIIPGVEYVTDGLGGVWQRDDANRWQLRYLDGLAVPRKVAAKNARGWNVISVQVGPLRPATPEEIETAATAHP